MSKRQLVPTHIRDLHPYKPGKPIWEVQQELGLETVYKLASNENPFGASPMALEAIRSTLSDLARYPDVGALTLRGALATNFSLKKENVICGSGSESIMATILRTFTEPLDEVLTCEGTFVGLYVLTQSAGLTLKTVPLKDYTFDLGAIGDAISEKTRIIYLANPNNPTGSIFGREAFERLMKRVPDHVLVILDEAYIEYVTPGADFPDSMSYRFDNVITLRTFSKAHGLAGLRVGYGFAHEDLITNLLKIKLPFEPSIPAQAAGMAALLDDEFLERTISQNARWRDHFHNALEEKGFRPVPSEANFVMFPMAGIDEAAAFTQHCLEQGVIVRPLPPFRIPEGVRVSTGLDHEGEAFLSALESWK